MGERVPAKKRQQLPVPKTLAKLPLFSLMLWVYRQPEMSVAHMMFSPEFAEKRFGYGLSPDVPPVTSVEAMLDGVRGPDFLQQQYPIEPFSTFRARMIEKKRATKQRKKARGTADERKIRKQIRLMQRDARQAKVRWFHQTLLRRIHGGQKFRERLTYFWGDHFTALGKQGLLRRATSPYLEETVRPHLAGRFADMLIACVTHPLMVHYLDQERSAGPNSLSAQKRKDKFKGANENLAREVLELHTLGVDGPYTQNDVRELAELFAGLTYKIESGLHFRKNMAEPGAEEVLGRTYSEDASLGAVHDVLHDLAIHPATAANVARKLAIHFVSDTPDEELIRHVESAYLASGGELMPVYAALLEHPSAWNTPAVNVKPPIEYVSSALRALAVPEVALTELNEKKTMAYFYAPLRMMGQIWQKPDGPDGWPEEDSAWITPQGLAARLEWAATVPARLLNELPDPRYFVDDALGADVPERVRFAARAAESRNEAIALVLASPAFQRR